MALAILDGTQTATTLSSVVTGGEHIVAHSVVSLGSNAISNIATAVSGSTVCVGNLGLLQSTVATEGLSASGSFIKIGGHTGTSTTGNIVHVSAVGALRVDGSVYTQPVSIASVTIGNTVTIAGTVTAFGEDKVSGGVFYPIPLTDSGEAVMVDIKGAFGSVINVPISGTVTANLAPQARGPIVEIDSSIPADPKYMAVVGGIYSNEYRSLKLGVNGEIIVSSLPAISGTVTVGNTVTIAGTVTIGAGTAQIGSVTASLAISSTAITSGSFASLTSATLVPGNTARKMATVYNLGAGQLFVNAGASATTLGGGFMLALSSGDYFECDYTTTTLSAIFATAGTASWVSH